MPTLSALRKHEDFANNSKCHSFYLRQRTLVVAKTISYLLGCKRRLMEEGLSRGSSAESNSNNNMLVCKGTSIRQSLNHQSSFSGKCQGSAVSCYGTGWSKAWLNTKKRVCRSPRFCPVAGPELWLLQVSVAPWQCSPRGAQGGSGDTQIPVTCWTLSQVLPAILNGDATPLKVT